MSFINDGEPRPLPPSDRVIKQRELETAQRAFASLTANGGRGLELLGSEKLGALKGAIEQALPKVASREQVRKEIAQDDADWERRHAESMATGNSSQGRS